MNRGSHDKCMSVIYTYLYIIKVRFSIIFGIIKFHINSKNEIKI
jgi:hypothetical protein